MGRLRSGIIAIATIVVLLTGCGGGSGGGSGPPPIVNDTTFGTVVINSGNSDLIGAGVSISEDAMELVQTAVNAVFEFASDGVPVRVCVTTGSLAIQHQDTDASFSISPGDILNITFTNCRRRITSGYFDGTIDITIAGFQLDSASVLFAGDLVTQPQITITYPNSPNGVATVTADVAFDFLQRSSEVLSVTATSEQHFSVDTDGATEAISDFSVEKTAIGFASGAVLRTDTTIDIFYDSEIYGGTFSCDSENIAFRNIDDIPIIAEIICRGLNGSAVRVINTNEVEVDPEGDDTYTAAGLFDWIAVVEGFIKKDSGLVFDSLSEINLRRISIRNNDVIYDALRDRLLVTTSASDPTNPNALVEVLPGNITIVPLVAYSKEPNLVRISEDGSIIYVTFTDSAEIWPYDAATLQALPVLEVQSDEVFSTEYGIRDLDVSPVDSDRIAVLFRFLGEVQTDVTLFDDGAQLPSTFRDVSTSNPLISLSRIWFTPGGDRIFVDDDLLEHDDNGVSAAKRLWGSLRGGRRYGDLILAGNRVIDGNTLVKLGTYVPVGVSWASAMDVANNLTFMTGPGVLNVFDSDTFVPLATYDLGPIGTGPTIRSIIPVGNMEILVEDAALHLVDVVDIETLNTDVCEVVTLPTDENEAYTNYDCPINDAVYDVVRDKIYVAIQSKLGVNGNSIAVINRASGLVESYIYVGSEPVHVEMSGDSNLLYVVFAGADLIATLDLNTLTVIRVSDIDVTAPSIDPNGLAPRHAMQIAASPVENDTFILSLGESRPSPFERMTAFRDGIQLTNEALRADLQGTFSNWDPLLIFDNGGQAYSLNNGFSDYVQSLTLGPAGLSAGSFFDVTDAPISVDSNNGAAGPDVVQNEVFTSSGGLINLATQVAEARYDPNAPSFNAGTGGLGINADVPAGDVYLLANGLGGFGIGRFDYATGALTAEQQFDFFTQRFFEESFFDIGTDQLGVIPNRDSGLVVIDKAAIQ